MLGEGVRAPGSMLCEKRRRVVVVFRSYSVEIGLALGVKTGVHDGGNYGILLGEYTPL